MKNQNQLKLRFLSVFLSLLFCFNLSPAYSQELNLAFESIGPEEGLDAGYNFFIKKDSRGLVWISSVNGLFQFDGIKTRKYISKLGEPNSMLGNNIQSGFFEDEKGDIWFTTDEGINVYQRETDDFKNYQFVDEFGDTINHDYRIFYLENNKNLWLKIDQSIYKYNLEAKKYRKISDTKGMTFDVALDEDGTVNSIYASPMINQSGFEIIERSSPEKFIRTTYWKKGYQGKSIDVRKAIVHSDSLVFFISKEGLIKFNRKIQKAELVLMPKNEVSNFRTGVLVDQDRLLIGGRYGLWLYNIKDNSFQINYSKKKNMPRGWETDNISALYIDHEEQLWMAHGRDSKVSYGWLFNNFFINPYKKFDLSISKTISIVEDFQDRTWTLSSNNSIHIFEKNGKHSKTLSIQHLNKESKSAELFTSPRGNVFLLAGEKIFTINKLEDNWDCIFSSNGGLNIHYLKPFNKNRIFFTSNQGLKELNFKPDKGWQTKDYVDRNFLNEDFVHFFLLSDSTLILPNSKNLLQIFKVTEDTLKYNFEVQLNFTIYGIEPTSVFNQFWISTDNGIKLIEINEKNLRIIQEITGTQQSDISNLIIDEDQKVWYTSFNGLTLYNPKLNKLVTFNMEDGLPSTNFPFFSSLKSSSGNIWLGVQNGCFYFNPKKITEYKFLPKHLIESIEINDIPFSFSTKPKKRIQLAYNKNTITFQVRSIGTFLPLKNQLNYRLTGHDNQWKSGAFNSKIKFPKLLPGQYSFEYFIKNANQINTSIKKINFEIDNPFWMKWWFFLICSFFIFGVAFSLNRIHFQQQIKTQKRIIEKQRMIQEERSRIAGELHDDLGSGLSVIKFLSENINLQTSKEKSQQHISKINLSAQSLLEKMSEIIWAMNSENDTLEALIYYLFRYAYDFLDTHNLNHKIIPPSNFPEIEITGEKRRNILLVVKEVLHNVTKHAQATEVLLKFEFKEEKLFLKIKDNGIGFVEDSNHTLGNGLKNIKRRTHKINGEIKILKENGTKVLIIIPFPSTKVI